MTQPLTVEPDWPTPPPEHQLFRFPLPPTDPPPRDYPDTWPGGPGPWPRHDPDWPAPDTPWPPADPPSYQYRHHGGNFNDGITIDRSRAKSTGPDDVDPDQIGGIMTQPLTVDLDQVIGAAGQWDGDLSGFDAPAPSVSGNSATHQAAQHAIGAAAADTDLLKQRLGQTADDARKGADAYDTQEMDNKFKLGPGDGDLPPGITPGRGSPVPRGPEPPEKGSIGIPVGDAGGGTPLEDGLPNRGYIGRAGDTTPWEAPSGQPRPPLTPIECDDPAWEDHMKRSLLSQIAGGAIMGGVASIPLEGVGAVPGAAVGGAMAVIRWFMGEISSDGPSCK